MRYAWKKKLYEVIFGTDTRAGKLFDLVLLWLIMISVSVVVLESIPSVNHGNSDLFFNIEMVFTVLFTVEYLLRIIVSPNRAKYIFSRWGFIDLLAILPFYLILLIPNLHYLLIIRLLRLLRVFRILKLLRFIKESEYIGNALKASAYKIIVFVLAVVTIVFFLGTLMYVVEGPENGYTSIPESIYYTIVTITTVGYGDITPQTLLGKLVACIIMLCGYAIIAVPTGIVTVEMSKQRDARTKSCSRCRSDNAEIANYCQICGEKF